MAVRREIALRLTQKLTGAVGVGLVLRYQNQRRGRLREAGSVWRLFLRLALAEDFLGVALFGPHQLPLDLGPPSDGARSG